MSQGQGGGRPTKLTPEIIEKIEKYLNEYEPWFECPVEKQDKEGNVTTEMKRVPNPPPDMMDIAKHLGVARSTVYDWADKNGKFSDSIKRLNKAYAEIVQKNAILGNYNAPFAIFAMKNRCGWTDKQTIDQTITHKLPAKITVELVRAGVK